MQKVERIKNKVYPAEKVRRLMQTPDGAIPWSKRPMVLAAGLTAQEEPQYICQVLNFSYDAETNQGSVDAIFATDLKEKQANPVAFVRLVGTLIDIEQETIVGQLQPVVKENDTFCELRTGFNLTEAMKDPQNLALLVEASWRNEFGESGMDLLHENNSEGDRTYTHERPKKEEKPEWIGEGFLDHKAYTEEELRQHEKSDRIRIVFKRAPEAITDVDYICMFGTIRDNHPNFGVPGRGKLSVEGGTIILDGENAPRATCTVIGADGAATETYTMDYPQTVFSREGGALVYDMTMGWNQRYQGAGDFVPVQFDYHLELRACFQVGTRVKKITQVITSRPSEGNIGEVHRIPKLEFMWGCFSEDTKILMYDGREKLVSDIRIGDIIDSADGYRRVCNVWKGREEKLVHLIYDGYKALNLTGDHPVLTSEGWYRAAALEPGMKVKAKNDEWVTLERVVWFDYGRTVYNFDINSPMSPNTQEPASMYANGLCVSDFAGQNQIRCVGEK